MAVEECAARHVHMVTEQLAYELWERRGCPLGSPEVDWFAAEESLTSMFAYSGLPQCAFSAESSEEAYR